MYVLGDKMLEKENKMYMKEIRVIVLVIYRYWDRIVGSVGEKSKWFINKVFKLS